MLEPGTTTTLACCQLAKAGVSSRFTQVLALCQNLALSLMLVGLSSAIALFADWGQVSLGLDTHNPVSIGLISAHFTHLNFKHYALNTLAMLIACGYIESISRGLLVTSTVCALLIINTGLTLSESHWLYFGASGLVSGYLCMMMLLLARNRRWRPWMIGALALLVLRNYLWPTLSISGEQWSFNVVTQAHSYGYAAAVLAYAAHSFAMQRRIVSGRPTQSKIARKCKVLRSGLEFGPSLGPTHSLGSLRHGFRSEGGEVEWGE